MIINLSSLSSSSFLRYFWAWA